MAFYLKEALDNQGLYGQVFWCGYEGDDRLYVAKRLKLDDFGLHIEKEAARRLVNLPTVYKIKGIERLGDLRYLVSHYISGVALEDYYSDNMENIFLHLLCTIQVMGNYDICHNDLHAGNIIVTKSSLTHVKYCFGVDSIKVKVNGELPVVLDFGLANIGNFRYRPMISGLASGNIASIANDNRFDRLKLFRLFSDLLESDTRICKIIKQLGKPNLKRVALWMRMNRGLIWDPINSNLEYKYNKLFSLVDYHSSGILLSFPPITMPNYDVVTARLTRLENAVNMSESTMVLILKTGYMHPLHHALCILGQLLRNGVQTLLAKFRASEEFKHLETEPLDRQVLDEIIRCNRDHIYRETAAI